MPAIFSSALGLWALRLLIILSFIAVLQFPLYSLLMKFWTDMFAISRSATKVYMLHAVFLAMTFLAVPKNKPSSILGSQLILINLVILLLFALGEFFILKSAFSTDISRTLFVRIGDNLDFSSTSIFHIHNAKAVMALMLGAFINHENLYRFDVGYPFLENYPFGILALHSVFFVIFILQLLISLRRDKDQSLSVYLCYCLSSLVILKGIVDGGPLDHSLLIALPFFLVPHLVRTLGVRERTALMASAGLVAILVVVRFVFLPYLFPHHLINMVQALLFYGFFYFLGLLWHKGSRASIVGYCLILPVVFIVLVYTLDLPKDMKELQGRSLRILEPGTELVTLLPREIRDSDLPIESELLGEASGYRLYKSAVKERLPYHKLSLLGFHLNYYDSNIVGEDCGIDGTYVIPFRVRVLSSTPVRQTRDDSRIKPFVRSIDVKVLSRSDFDLLIEYQPCVPLPESVMMLVLDHLGIDRALVENKRHELEKKA